MISLASEIPIPNLKELSQYTDFSFALTHMVEKSEEYANFYKKQSELRHTILDNSAFELPEPVSPERLLAAADKVNADVVIIPDIIGDTEKSKKLLLKFLTEYSHITHIKFGAVMHGKTLFEALNYLIFLDRLDDNFWGDEIDTICIPFDLPFIKTESQTESWMLSRIYLIQIMHNLKLYNPEKNYHLLGCSNPLEFTFYKDKKWITSVDTSNPVQQAVLGQSYDRALGVPHKKKALVDFTKSLTDEQKEKAVRNFLQLREWLS